MEDNRQKKVRKIKEPLWIKGKLDIPFLSLVLILLTVGLVMLFSASYDYSYAYMNNSYHFILRQFIFAVIGVAAMLVISKINYRRLRKYSKIIYGVSMLLLAILLALPPMVKGVDVKRWMVLGPISFQPSEIAKFSIILLLAHYISKNRDKMGKPKEGFGIPLIFLAICCGLVVFEPHMSATILIFVIGIVMMVIGGTKWRYLLFGGAFGAVLGGIAIVSGIIGYGGDRIKYWLNPWADASGKGYQTIQSLLAIGSGGILGRGFGKSRQKQLWVPEPHNDFIFSIVCEELGLIGALIIIALFCLLVWRGFIIAMRAPDTFGSLFAVGLTFQVGLQAALNILVVTNTVPNTGISLPFFSYGGTALLLLLAQMGIVLSISRASFIEKS